LLGKRLREGKKISFLAGVEKDPGMAEIAKNEYDEVIMHDLEEDGDLPFEKGYFDVIICADVLEHLREPVEVLKKLSAYLSETGFFLISVPNVAFVTVRLSLLLGKFNYSPQGGILDATHLRFFTRESFIETLKKANLKPFYIRGYNLVQPNFFFLKILGSIFPTLFSIQFLVKAKKVNKNG
jgi:2-polyprenyl-3-methyl-5-hydroxy-6-metoxy-1,4-benzoquinol methylase